MRRENPTARSGAVLAAFWWTLAALHALPAWRVATDISSDPSAGIPTIGLLLLVIAFCGIAGQVSRGGPTARHARRATAVFLLVAAVAHHDAIGSMAPAELPGPVTPVLVAGAVVAAAGRLGRIAGRAARRLGHALAGALATPIDLLERASGTTRAAPASQAVRAVIGGDARGPPA